MKMQAVVEVVAETYEEEQFILRKFPSAVWVAPAGMNKGNVLFFLPYAQYAEIKKAIDEWNSKGES